MARILSWSLWVAGILALLAAVNQTLNLVSLALTVLIFRFDVLLLAVAFICFLNAYLVLGLTGLPKPPKS
ncbi:MAG: hypothetical protein HXY22_00905 [Alphaproteobacteria bacterium]|nr:hypothetical protein [Alphaproteobacteria bacterium]